MHKTKIEWCDTTWNPVWGCLNNCSYCYARKIAKRFGAKFGVKDFTPTWIESNYNKPFPKKSARIFVNSMSDIAFWKREWMKRVMFRISHHPEHQFLFLTKRSITYDFISFPENVLLGVTITRQKDMDRLADLITFTTFGEKNKIFISVEPVLEEIELTVQPDWLIIGAETGNRKGRIIPKREWIEKLIRQADCPVFLKDNLESVWGEELCQEFPAI